MSDKQHPSRSWDFPDSFAAFQHRDEQIDRETEAYERRMMQDPDLGRGFCTKCGCPEPCRKQACLDACLADADYYDGVSRTDNLIDFDESCIAGRGDLLHLAKAMIGQFAGVGMDGDSACALSGPTSTGQLRNAPYSLARPEETGAVFPLNGAPQDRAKRNTGAGSEPAHQHQINSTEMIERKP